MRHGQLMWPGGSEGGSQWLCQTHRAGVIGYVPHSEHLVSTSYLYPQGRGKWLSLGNKKKSTDINSHAKFTMLQKTTRGYEYLEGELAHSSEQWLDCLGLVTNDFTRNHQIQIGSFQLNLSKSRL